MFRHFCDQCSASRKNTDCSMVYEWLIKWFLMFNILFSWPKAMLVYKNCTFMCNQFTNATYSCQTHRSPFRLFIIMTSKHSNTRITRNAIYRIGKCFPYEHFVLQWWFLALIDLFCTIWSLLDDSSKDEFSDKKI